MGKNCNENQFSYFRFGNNFDLLPISGNLVGEDYSVTGFGVNIIFNLYKKSALIFLNLDDHILYMYQPIAVHCAPLKYCHANLIKQVCDFCKRINWLLSVLDLWL